MPRAQHTKHDFTRLLSEDLTGRAVFGCNYGSSIAGCSETEVRHKNAPSPFALKLEQAKRAQQRRQAITA